MTFHSLWYKMPNLADNVLMQADNAEQAQNNLNGAAAVQLAQMLEKKKAPPKPITPKKDTPLALIFGCTGAIDNGYHEAKEFIAGVECEIENVTYTAGEVASLQFSATNDGSLRNNGVEFISTPLTETQLLLRFHQLHKHLKVKDDSFSSRTSTHVHVNCSNLTLAQARTLVLLYALFEEFFFMMVKPERRDNIHCVPLTETYLPTTYKHDLLYMKQRWSKYAALNLIRLKDLGTFEFRHLHGTNDTEEFKMWVRTLKNLWTLALVAEITKDSLNEMNISLWFMQIFKDAPQILAHRPVLFDIIANNLIDVKFSCVS